MVSGFPQLLAPGRIGPMALRNRIVLCPIGDTLAEEDGTVSERQLAFYEARARGGAGLVLVGSVSVAYPAGSYHACQTAASTDAHLAGLRALAERAHRHGAAIAAQLVHDGPASLLDIATGRPLLVPSRLPQRAPDALSGMVTGEEADAMLRPFTGPRSRLDAREATDDDLWGVITAFADAAERAAVAGFDGVEIHAGHGYLVDAFLSPASNRRDDAWGGDLEGRARLLLEIVTGVRARVGDRLAVWCRLNAEERHREGGETLDDALRVVDLLEAAGVDAVHVSAYADPRVAIGITDAHTPHQPGALVPLAGAVKRRCAVPVIAFGRLEPELAEQVLADGRADFVGMGRQLLADPDLPRKLAEGRPDDVRPCLYQYRCIGNIFLGRSVACVARPATGDGDEDRLGPARRPRSVLVVGGGPAGLEAARLMGERGHRVSVWEAGERLGGRLALAARADRDLEAYLGWLLRQVEGSSIELSLATRAEPEGIAAAGFDAVVVATGATWRRPDVERAVGLDDLGGWLAADDGVTVGASVAVLGGGKAGLSLAALLADRGREVSVFDPTGVFAVELGLPGRFRLVHDVQAAGVTLVGRAWEPDELGPFDTVVAAAPGAPRVELADALMDRGLTVHVLGDASGSRGLEPALRDARRLASSLG